MFSPFVKGLMCATLLYFGLSGCFGFVEALVRHAPATSALVYAPGVLFVGLAALLFTPSLLMPRMAFWTLLVLGFCNLTAPFVSSLTQIGFPESNLKSVFYGLIYLFPCVVALLTDKRHGSPDV